MTYSDCETDFVRDDKQFICFINTSFEIFIIKALKRLF